MMLGCHCLVWWYLFFFGGGGRRQGVAHFCADTSFRSRFDEACVRIDTGCPKEGKNVIISCHSNNSITLFLSFLMFLSSYLLLPFDEYSFLLLIGYRLFVIKRASAALHLNT